MKTLILLCSVLVTVSAQQQSQAAVQQQQAQQQQRYVKPQQSQQAQQQAQAVAAQLHQQRLHQAQLAAQQQHQHQQQQQAYRQVQQAQPKPVAVSRASPNAIPGSYKKPQQQQQQGKPQQQLSAEELEDYYDDEAKPDKLTEMLKQSKFNCGSKKDGYYADDTLNCEVFHYCQESKKHSWMCPEGFQFHQVHLICMPPSADSICSKSTSFHFVNEYLYRPLNAEHAAATNTSLRYADRYYPNGYNAGTPIDEMEVQEPHAPRAPTKFGHFYNSQDVRLQQRQPPRKQSKEEYDY